MHHIYPKSIFGENDNLVRLTIREHILCHILLWKHFRKLKNIKATKSAWYSVHRTFKCAEVKGRAFEITIKKLAIQILSKREELSLSMTGENNPFFGKIHSEETRRKISESGAGRILSDATKNNQSNSHKNRIKNNPGCMDYLKKFNTGRKLPEQQVEKIAKANRTHIFSILTPDGIVVITDELSKFCAENLLSKGNLYATLPGKSRDSHKGFKLLEKVKKCLLN